MKHHWWGWVGAGNSSGMDERSRDEQAVRGQVQASWAAWDAGDAEAYGACFAADVDYVAFDGQVVRGRAAVVDGHALLFATVLRRTRLRGEIEAVRFVSGDVAVVHAWGGAVWPWQRGVPADRLSRQTYVVVRAGVGWSITAFHNTRVRPTPAPDSLGFRMFAWVVRLRLRLGGYA